MAAMPCPPPMHMVARAYRPSVRLSLYRDLTARMAPVAPMGWPREIPLPFGLVRSGGRSSSWRCRVAPEWRQRGIRTVGTVGGWIASAAVLRGNQQDRAVRVLGDLAGHRAHHQPGKAARAA